MKEMFAWLRRRHPQREQAHRWVSDGATLLDVRTPAEFDRGHLSGAINIPLQDLSARLSELDASRKIVVYCRSGGRSGGATKALKAAGFSEVLDLGAMSNW